MGLQPAAAWMAMAWLAALKPKFECIDNDDGDGEGGGGGEGREGEKMGFAQSFPSMKLLTRSPVEWRRPEGGTGTRRPRGTGRSTVGTGE